MAGVGAKMAMRPVTHVVINSPFPIGSERESSIPFPTSEVLEAIEICVKMSAPELPRERSVTPATAGDSLRKSEMRSTEGTKNLSHTMIMMRKQKQSQDAWTKREMARAMRKLPCIQVGRVQYVNVRKSNIPEIDLQLSI